MKQTLYFCTFLFLVTVFLFYVTPTQEGIWASYYSGELSRLKRQKVRRKTLYLKGFFSHSSSPQLDSLGLDIIFLSSLSQARGLDLSRVRACVVVAEERPRMALTLSFSKLFKDLGLHPRSVSTAFGCRVNLAICLQVKSKPAAPADYSVHAVITKTW